MRHRERSFQSRNVRGAWRDSNYTASAVCVPTRTFVYGPGIDEAVRMRIMPKMDIDDDGNSTMTDVYIMKDTWLLRGEDTGFDDRADLNHDGVVNNIDADILAGNWKVALQNAACYYYHYNGLGSVTAVSDKNGQIVETYKYSVFGDTAIYNASGKRLSASAVGNVYFFTGRRLDNETGLYYYRARMYSPHLGRFLQTDPSGYSDGINWYLYCGNNPIVLVDPLGLCDSGSIYAADDPSWLQRFEWWMEENTGWGSLVGDGSYSTVYLPDGSYEVMPRNMVRRLLGMGEGGHYAADGTQIPLIAGTAPDIVPGGSGSILKAAKNIISKIDDAPALVRHAENAGKSVQGSLDNLTNQLSKGNMNPGTGTKHLFNGIMEARSKDGARVYFRNATDGTVEILGKSNKANQPQVINILKEKYGG